jgi:ATP-dependent RNA helicase RhlE
MMVDNQAHERPSAGVPFSQLGLVPSVLAVLERLRFTVPTPIQVQAIPVAVEGKDIIGIAQTGTGKTLAFALPMLQHIARKKQRGLVIVPTRELATQVDEAFHAVGRSFGLRTALVIGGASMQRQTAAIRQRPHVLIGTPGRMIDHLQQGTLQLKDVGILVLDEADRMLDMGFAPQIAKILQHVPRERQTMLFSATMPAGIVTIATRHMKMPVRVEVAPAGTVASRVNQDLYIVKKEEKTRLLGKLLSEHVGAVLVFSRTKHGAKRICRSLRASGHNVAEIHSNLSLSQRRKSLEGFKSGRYRVLVATDIAARGIDVQNIEVVLNYDLPDNPEDYVHRVGRTGRAGREGLAISFITPDQRGKIRGIERLVRKSLRVSPLPELPPHPAGAPPERYETERAPSSQRRPYGQQRRQFHSGRGRRRR